MLGALFALAVLAAVVFLVFRSGDSDQRSRGANDLAGATPPGHESSRPSPLSAERQADMEASAVPREALVPVEDQARPTRCIAFEVLDELTGAPLELAAVLRDGPVGRIVFQDAAGVLARTGPDGRAQACDLTEGPLAFAVTARGYTPARVDVAADVAACTVRLSPGFSLTVRCQDNEGRPVPESLVFASRAQMPPPSELLASVEHGGMAGLGKGAVFGAQAGEDGIAVLSGLAEGRYLVNAVRSGYAAIEISPLEGNHVPPEDSATVTLVPILAVVFETVGDECVSYSISGPTDPSSNTFSSLPLTAMGGERKALEARFPEAEVATFALTQPTESPFAHVTLLLRRKGLQEFDLPLRRSDLIEDPEQIDVDGLPETTGCVATTVRIRDAADQALPKGLFRIDLDGGMSLPLQEGEMCLTAGSYALRCRDARLAGLYSPLEVHIPGDIVITVTQQLQPVRLHVVDENGGRYGSHSVSVQSLGKTTWSYTLDDSERLHHLPLGPASFTVKVAGFDETIMDANVIAKDGVQEVTLVLHE